MAIETYGSSESLAGISEDGMEVAQVPSTSVANAKDTLTVVARGFSNTLDRKIKKLPWETGVMKQIFGDVDMLPNLTMPGNWTSGDTTLDGLHGTEAPHQSIPECSRYIKPVLARGESNF